jgi:putative transcriptional regulator
MQCMFVESIGFTQRVVQLGLEEDLRRLQNQLNLDPRAGTLDPGTGGLRKVRMTDSSRGRGKRGGARVHYLFAPERGVIYLVSIYPKNEQVTLAPDQKRVIARVARLIDTE